MINFQDIKNAKKRIDPYIYHTPLEKSLGLSNDKRQVYLKLENQQKLKCYKLRGALSKITSLSKEELDRGLVAISSGNHGAAVSYAASILGLESSKIYLPETTPTSKIEKILHYGGQVVKYGKNFDQANEYGLARVEEEGSIYIDSSSDVDVIAGQGTIGLEIMEDNPSIDTILVPIGGGGLISGISIAAKAINPKVKIIGLQTAACPAMIASLRDNIFYQTYPSDDSICDALVGGVGEIPYQLARETIDHIIEVEEEDIREAVRYMLLEEKTLAEGAGAIALAGLRTNPQLFQEGNIALVVSGGNIDKELLLNILKD